MGDEMILNFNWASFEYIIILTNDLKLVILLEVTRLDFTVISLVIFHQIEIHVHCFKDG